MYDLDHILKRHKRHVAYFLGVTRDILKWAKIHTLTLSTGVWVVNCCHSNLKVRMSHPSQWSSCECHAPAPEGSATSKGTERLMVYGRIMPKQEILWFPAYMCIKSYPGGWSFTLFLEVPANRPTQRYTTVCTYTCVCTCTWLQSDSLACSLLVMDLWMLSNATLFFVLLIWISRKIRQ